MDTFPQAVLVAALGFLYPALELLGCGLVRE